MPALNHFVRDQGGQLQQHQQSEEFMETEQDIDWYYENLSEEEVLLACHAYLQRHKKLGKWKEAEKRLSHRDRNIGSDDIIINDNMRKSKSKTRMKSKTQRQKSARDTSFIRRGYFWDDPDELKYYSPFTTVERNQKQEENEKSQIIVEEESYSDNDKDEYYSDALPPFETSPSQEHINRSNAARKLWSSPKFRKSWYKKRWGALSRNKGGPYEKQREAQYQRQLQKKIEKIPSDILYSKEMMSLSEMELQDAVVTYVQSKQKRSRTIRLKNDSYRIAVESASSDKNNTSGMLTKHHWSYPLNKELADTHNTFMDSTSDEYKHQLMIQRSERARKAYQTRLSNQQKDKKRKNKKKKHKTTEQEVNHANDKKSSSNKITKEKHAMIRIEESLLMNQIPKYQDVETILEKPRLTGRKPLLLRVLKESFGLYGKCIPISIYDNEGDGVKSKSNGNDGKKTRLIFASRATIYQLGNFILDLINEKEVE